MVNYSYDLDGQLTSASGTDWGSSFTWTGAYDPAGNRTRVTPNATSTYFGLDKANQVCATSASAVPACPAGAPNTWSTFTYDLAGNQTASGGTPALTAAYDRVNRLTTLNGSTLDYLTPTNGELVSVGATVLQNNVMGLGRSGTTAYTRDPGDASLVAQRTSGGTDYVFGDWLGSTSALFTSATTAASTLPRTYTYWPTGNQRATTGTGNTTDIQYAGGHVVNNNLHYGARWYNPTTGTWTQADRLLLVDDLQQSNRYTYVGGNLANLTDPSGEVAPALAVIGALAAQQAAKYAAQRALTAGLANASRIVSVGERQAANASMATGETVVKPIVKKVTDILGF